MKKIIAMILIIGTLLVSCASYDRTGRPGMYPMRYIPVENIADLQSGSFEIIGMVTGSGNVNAEDPSDGDSLSYGSLEFMEGDRMYYTVDVYEMSDPYEVALSNAIAELIENAQKMGAAFVTFPSYTLKLSEGRVIANISAVAVRVVNPETPIIVENTSPLRVEVVFPEAN